MTRAEAHRLLDAVRDHGLQASPAKIREALTATGDMDCQWFRALDPVVSDDEAMQREFDAVAAA